MLSKNVFLLLKQLFFKRLQHDTYMTDIGLSVHFVQKGFSKILKLDIRFKDNYRNVNSKIFKVK